ncbi:uncharacterized protein N7459_003813 [Penicillium hispanicum]|uniref:uncharacterized protein n=1 Tax=Penicillium hispanicum TaxID=1080232 RepID=UPI0025416ABC|nr:uncharacterized protein N7459_003813 [Penicillium hispanicum]KAJ5584013.1 hypothetical protein N7459_003813 [Penicillium hispanicum]
MIRAASKITDLHHMRSLGPKTQVIFMGWDEAAVEEAANHHPIEEARCLQDEEDEWERGWPGMAVDLSLDIHRTDTPGVFQAGFDFGVLKGVTIICSDQFALDEYCAQADRHGESDWNSYLEEEFDEEDGVLAEEYFQLGAKRNPASAPMTRRKKLKTEQYPPVEYLLRLKCREMAEGMIYVKPYDGTIIFENNTFASFQAVVYFPAAGQGVSFFARKISGPQERPDTLPVEIAQINSQWGSFRDVNEEVLRAKIAEEEARAGAPQSPEGDQDSADVDSTEHLEQLYKRRADITQFAMQSHMETMFALDFISLVLSKHAPRQAETSMSAFLKQVAPLGSLNSEVIHPPPRPESATKDISTVSRGWKAQNFNAASNKLLSAASRLEGEIASETRYWSEVLAVKDKGWKICRLPRERQALGVQYGFLEATPVFRDRGLASLRRADNGSLILDKGLVPAGVRYVRVRVRQGSLTSSSTRPTESASGDAESVEHRILQARDSVFEEELFHELVREARAMASCGVTTRQNLIQIPASDDIDILLDLIDADDDHVHLEQDTSGPDGLLAEGFAHSIRILLAFAHRQNLRRRTQVPPPLTPKRRASPEYHLLRPALAYLQHLSQVRWLESFLNEIGGVLRSSGLDAPASTSTAFSSRALQFAPSTPTLEALVIKSLTPIESVFRGNLLTPGGFFAITVRTSLSSPPFGTNFEVSFNFPAFSDLKSPGRLGLRDEVTAAIIHLLLLDVVSRISSQELPAMKPDSESEGPTSRAWIAAYPHLGELLLSSSDPEKHKKMKVTLSRHELSLSTYMVRSIDGIGRGAQEQRSQHAETHTWKSPSPSASEANEHPSMMEFVVTEASN